MSRIVTDELIESLAKKLAVTEAVIEVSKGIPGPNLRMLFNKAEKLLEDNWKAYEESHPTKVKFRRLAMAAFSHLGYIYL